MIKEHHVTVLIFIGRDFSPGVTGRAKQELFIIHATQNTACAERVPCGGIVASTPRKHRMTGAARLFAGTKGGCYVLYVMKHIKESNALLELIVLLPRVFVKSYPKRDLST
jgi:hypothetical protein